MTPEQAAVSSVGIDVLSEAPRLWATLGMASSNWVLILRFGSPPPGEPKLTQTRCKCAVKPSERVTQSVIELSKDDVAGVAAMGRRGGWFGVLDCAVPVRGS